MQRSNVRISALPALFFALATLTACGGDDPMEPTGGGGGGGSETPVMTTSVDVDDNSFDPTLIQVSPGATVTWTWAGTTNPHNVTFSDAPISGSPTQDGSATFSTAMPTEPGDYSYQCTIHPSLMTGTVRVQ